MNYKKFTRTLKTINFANKKLFSILFLTVPFLGFTQDVVPTVPINEVTNEKKSAVIVLINNDTLKGIVNFNEYGNRNAYLQTGIKDGKPLITTIKEDSIQFMSIADRGDFYRLPNKTHIALLIDNNEAFKEYRLFYAKQGLLGAKFSGGNIEGYYNYYLEINKTKKLYFDGDVKNLDKTITEYIDYCSEVTDKVKKEEKGYKKTLMKSAYVLLKEVLKESQNKCGNK